MAAVSILSGFNGIESLVESLYYNAFDSDLTIEPTRGKTFSPDSIAYEKLLALDGVERSTKVIEENVLLKKEERQTVASIKGISVNYIRLTDKDTIIKEGKFLLEEKGMSYGVIGSLLRNELSLSIQGQDDVSIYAPIRGKKISRHKEKAFNKKRLLVSGVFSVNIDYDAQFLFVPLEFAADLFGFENEVSSIEIFIKKGQDPEEIKQKAQELLGNQFTVKTKYEKNELVYKTNNVEKWFTFLILIFILIIAGFNLIASLTMLVIDKQKDGKILMSMGLTKKKLAAIFTVEGLLINFLGACIGLILGFLLCLAQQKIGLIPMENSIVPYYPIEIQWLDYVQVFLAVLVIAVLCSWLPVKYLVKRHFDL